MTENHVDYQVTLGSALVGVIAVLAGVATIAALSSLWMFASAPFVWILYIAPPNSWFGVVGLVISFGQMFASIPLARWVARRISGPRAGRVAVFVSACLLLAYLAATIVLTWRT